MIMVLKQISLLTYLLTYLTDRKIRNDEPCINWLSKRNSVNKRKQKMKHWLLVQQGIEY